MARMIPTSLQYIRHTTAGERKVFELLKWALPGECTVRYEMLVGYHDYRPDFTIIDPARGVIVIEVKDWSIDHIVEATEQQIIVRGIHGNSYPKRLMNPELKCSVYLRDTKEQLAGMASLRDGNDHLAIPVYYFIAFPNINRSEMSSSSLNRVLKGEHYLLSEDLKRPKSFLSAYHQRVEKLPAELDEGQRYDITLALFPDIILPQVSAGGFIPSEGEGLSPGVEPADAFTLSLDQEEIAKSLGRGPRLLRGIAGSGKTLILLYRAKLLASNHPKAHILLLCWNTALATYMQQAYQKFDITASGKVTIQHFTEFARNLLGLYRDPRIYEWDDPRVMTQLNSLKTTDNDRYDAVFIDEAQDFRGEWIEYIFNHLIKGRPEKRTLIIAADDAQRVYTPRNIDWEKLQIPFIKQTRILRTIYRNSARIWIFSAFLLEEKASYVHDPKAMDEIRFATKSGFDPQLVECPSLKDQVAYAASMIEDMLQSGYSARNVLILYRHNPVPWLNHFPLVGQLTRELDRRSIPWDWIAEDASAKRNFAWEAPRVKISTVQSAKGMDSPIVIILGAETFDPSYTPSQDYDESAMMYVALTRAREFLLVLHSGDGGIVPKLKDCMREYQKYRDVIIANENQWG